MSQATGEIDAAGILGDIHGMIVVGQWRLEPPEVAPATRLCLTEPGSLTERLMASGRQFAVDVLYQGDGIAHDDEAALVGRAAGDTLTARHVALTLDRETVVVARSFCRQGCAVWEPVLNRGRRSLGFTLFSGEVSLSRGALEYASVDRRHPLFTLARSRDTSADLYPARRCRFETSGAALVVCEVLLPALETQLSKSTTSLAR